jgi:ABC-type multidrug transport system ATPase subunit
MSIARDFSTVAGGDGVVGLRGVRKRYGRRGAWVLHGVDAEFASGSGSVIVGSNGSGKSTLLRLLVGVTLPTQGEVTRGRAPAAYAPERLAGNIRMTAGAYLTHMARLRGLDRDAARVRIEQLQRGFAIAPGLDAPVRSLSKGNSQKVALIQAFLAPVRLLVLDEPYGGLDSRARDALSDLIAASIGAGTAVVLSSHIPIHLHASTRVLQLSDGVLTQTAAASSRAEVAMRLAPVSATASVDDLRSMPGITTIRVDATGDVEVVVEPARSDEVLGAVLQRGWSVRHVDTSDARRDEGRS